MRTPILEQIVSNSPKLIWATRPAALTPSHKQIENYKTDMPMQWHRGQGIGIHSQGYNQAWQNFIAQNPSASAQQVLQFLSQLEQSMGFGL